MAGDPSPRPALVIDRLAKICSCGALLALLATGCGNHDVAVPAECTEGPAVVRTALAHAPGDVRLDGRVHISDCFQQAASPADVENVGSIVIQTADGLADRARAAPHSRAAVELGYLVGAVRRGAGTDSSVHYESRRRVEQSLVGVATGTPEFRRGFAAGRDGG